MGVRSKLKVGSYNDKHILYPIAVRPPAVQRPGCPARSSIDTALQLPQLRYTDEPAVDDDPRQQYHPQPEFVYEVTR